MSPNRVFWGMIDNNLATTSVTRHVVQKQQGQTNDQYIQMLFGQQNAARSQVVFSQEEASGKSVVKSETIGMPKIDYSRYTSIDTQQKTASGKAVDSSGIIGVWASSEGADPEFAGAQYFQQSVLSIAPFANFRQEIRSELVGIMKDKKVYDIKSAKSDKQDGKSVFIYEVEINPEAYVAMLQRYVIMLGLKDAGLNPSQYANSPALKAQFVVDKLSRNLLKVAYKDSEQGETLSAYGLETPVEIPSNTISIAELQKRVQESLR